MICKSLKIRGTGAALPPVSEMSIQNSRLSSAVLRTSSLNDFLKNKIKITDEHMGESTHHTDWKSGSSATPGCSFANAHMVLARACWDAQGAC